MATRRIEVETGEVRTALLRAILLDRGGALPTGPECIVSIDARRLAHVEDALGISFAADVLVLIEGTALIASSHNFSLFAHLEHSKEARELGLPAAHVVIGHEGRRWCLVDAGAKDDHQIWLYDDSDQSMQRVPLATFIDDAIHELESESDYDCDESEKTRERKNEARAQWTRNTRLVVDIVAPDVPPPATIRRVRHAKFGDGNVVKEDPATTGDTKLVIMFEDGTSRTVAARFVRDLDA